MDAISTQVNCGLMLAELILLVALR